MPENLILISLTIGQSSYKLKIPAEKESQIRNSVTALNIIIEKYKTAFAGQKEHDYLAMAFIAFISEQDATGADNADILEALKAIDNSL